MQRNARRTVVVGDSDTAGQHAGVGRCGALEISVHCGRPVTSAHQQSIHAHWNQSFVRQREVSGRHTHQRLQRTIEQCHASYQLILPRTLQLHGCVCLGARHSGHDLERLAVRQRPTLQTSVVLCRHHLAIVQVRSIGISLS